MCKCNSVSSSELMMAEGVLLRGRRRSSREEARLLVLGVWLLTAVEVADGAL